MSHKYHLAVQPIDGSSNAHAGDALTFEVFNHDDLFDVLARMQGRKLLPEDEVTPFIVGLKLFSEVLVRHRREPLFADLCQTLGSFMKRLKGQGAPKPPR